MPLEITWAFEQREVETIRSIVLERQNLGRYLVSERWQRNVVGEPPPITQEEIWFAQMMCLLTTQQRSGPNSLVTKFLLQTPFPITLDNCRKTGEIANLVKNKLSAFGGFRRYNLISEAAQKNYGKLESGGWSELMEYADALLQQRRKAPVIEHQILEQEAAMYMAQYTGFGPKQSRNFWQYLGLSRYAFVLDSRIMSWLRDNIDFGILPLSSICLNDENYYRMMSNLLLELCSRANILPCMFDAAVFDSFDTADWSGYL